MPLDIAHPNITMAKFVQPSGGAEVADIEKRQMKFCISTDKADRDGDRVMQDGMRHDKFMKNPIVLWNHNSYEPPIGRALKLEKGTNKTMAIAQFMTADESEFADQVFKMYKGGYLSGVSIGFIPIDLSPSETKGERFVIKSCELIEFSAVPIPANPDALVQMKSSDCDPEWYVEWLEKSLDEKMYPEYNELMFKGFTLLTKRVHPIKQALLREKNIGDKSLQQPEHNSEFPDDQVPDGGEGGEVEEPGEVSENIIETGVGGEVPHQHKYVEGATETMPDETGHIHAIQTDVEGNVFIEAAAGHSHPLTKVVKEGDVETKTVETGDELPVTNFPEKGDNEPICFANSNYKRFPMAEALAFKAAFPALWGDDDELFNELVSGNPSEEAIKKREEMAGKVIGANDGPSLVAQMKCLVVGEGGLDAMRSRLALYKASTVPAQKGSGVDEKMIHEALRVAVPQVMRAAFEGFLQEAHKTSTGGK